MCDGNLRSTIKALIMANEYLEAELQELQAATLRHGNTARLSRAEDDAPDRTNWSDTIWSNTIGSNTMADVTYYVALPFQRDDGGSPVAGAAEECQSSSGALRRAESCQRPRAASARSRSAAPAIR